MRINNAIAPEEVIAKISRLPVVANIAGGGFGAIVQVTGPRSR